jgi:hypothetical protein
MVVAFGLVLWAHWGIYKFRVRPNARRGKIFAAPHIDYMQARKFSPQRSITSDWAVVFWQLSRMAITRRLATVFWWLSGMASSFISSSISWDEI